MASGAETKKPPALPRRVFGRGVLAGLAALIGQRLGRGARVRPALSTQEAQFYERHEG